MRPRTPATRPPSCFCMDEWLENAPALLFLNNAWVLVNKWGEPLSWTEDTEEAAWIVRCVLEHQEIKKQRAEKPKLKIMRVANPISLASRPSRRVPSLVLPSRKSV